MLLLKKVIFLLLILTSMSLQLNASAWVRINQLGYLPKATKVAVLMSQDKAAVTSFQLVDAHTGKVVFKSTEVKPTGALQHMKSTYRLNFSSFTKPGTYYIQVNGIARSPQFVIDSGVYDGTADFVLNYMRQQRCGFNPFQRDSCHQKDGYIKYHPSKDGQVIDVRGGWHDAAHLLQYTTTSANAIYQNIGFIENYDPENVLILSGDHIYKMDYAEMIEAHIRKGADATLAVIEVPWAEASRFGILNTKDDDVITEFVEKPAKPESNLASMGVYVFTWDVLRKALIEDEENPDSNNDFGMNIVPMLLASGKKLCAYRFSGYWKDVGTISSLWEANQDLLGSKPKFDIYDSNWKIYSRNMGTTPQFISSNSVIENSLIASGAKIYGKVTNSIISNNVIIEEGAEVIDSVIFSNSIIKKGAKVNYSIIDENVVINEESCVGGPKSTDVKITVIGREVVTKPKEVIPTGANVEKGE